MLPSWLSYWIAVVMEWIVDYALYWVTGKTCCQRICDSYEVPERTIYLDEKVSRMSSEAVAQTMAGYASADVDEAVNEICIAEGVPVDARAKLSIQLRSCLVQIHSVAGVRADVERLRTMKFNCTNSQHEDSLLELWSLLQPDVALSDRISKQWTDIGFQGTDPATDFRGMGYLSLLNLLYFAKQRTNAARRLLLHSQHPSIGYGYGIAGINITSLLLELFTSNHLQPYFYKLCRDRPATLDDFHDLFCNVFEQFDKFWIAKKPENVMAFNTVRGQYKEQLEVTLLGSYTYILPEEHLGGLR